MSSTSNGALERDLQDSGEAKEKPCLLFMGLRKSGKSSIQNVVFHRLSPQETLFLESTNKINQHNFSSFIDFQIWDFPGELELFDPSFNAEAIFSRTDALIYVIDAQDEYIEALQRLYMTVTRAYKINPKIYFEVFIHKVDGLTDYHKIEIQRSIHESIMDELLDAQLDNIHITFYLTSIYDHSIYEALSKVIQKLIVQLPTLENLLNILWSNSQLEKAFLFDTASKIYIATDSSPVDMQSYEICSDMIDVVMDMTSIYGNVSPRELISVDSKDSQTIIHLANGTVLYMRGVSGSLALVCLLRKDNFVNEGILDYNFKCFQKALVKVFA